MRCWNYYTSALGALVCLISWFPTAARVSAQSFVDVAAAAGTNVGTTKTGGIAWGDINDDGCFDQLVNGGGRSFLLFQNKSGGTCDNTFTDVTLTHANGLATRNRERSAVLGDFNRDGLLDFAVNTSHSGVDIYLNRGAADAVPYSFGNAAHDPSQVFTQWVGPTPVNTEGMAAADFDGDNDLDIVVESHNFGIHILENNGSGVFSELDPATTGLTVTGDNGDYAAFADLDQNGTIDILARRHGFTPQDAADIWFNTGSASGGWFTHHPVDMVQSENSNKGGVSVCDFDNDGDFDLVWTGRSSHPNPADQVTRIYEQTAPQTFAVVAGWSVTAPINSANGSNCFDADNDGDIDLLLLGNGGQRQLYINNTPAGGMMSFTEDNRGIMAASNSSSAEVADYDLDGDLDIAVNATGANELWANNPSIPLQQSYLVVRPVDENPDGSIRDSVGASIRFETCAGTGYGPRQQVDGGSNRGNSRTNGVFFGLGAVNINEPLVLRVTYPDGTEVVRAVSPGRMPGYHAITVTRGSNDDLGFCDLDKDNDNVDAFDDPDEDNDGISDVDELGGMDLSGDANGNHILDWQDASVVVCVDAPIANGVCDTLPANVDKDGDGIPNHHDLDSDNDGIPDALESGSGADANGDGIIDGPDSDGDGIRDAVDAAPGDGNNATSTVNPRVTDNGDMLPDFLDRDSDNDGITDAEEAGYRDTNGDGVPDNWADANDDGLTDSLISPRNTDGDSGPVVPDYIDTDSDNDGLLDSVEGHDANHDGNADRTPIGTDGDQDGIDDIFDPDGAGTIAVLQDQDSDGTPDYRDTCGDGDQTAGEACDDGNAVNGDGCSNTCALEGCNNDADCGGLTPFCETVSRECVACLNAGHCDDGNDCTTDACVANVCSNSDSASGAMCASNGGAVCDGSGACVECVADAQCGGATPLCDVGSNTCVACLGAADCADGNTCTNDVCNAGVCSNPNTAVATSCGGSNVCDGSGACVACVSNAQCGGGTPLCDVGNNTCVECLGAGDCSDGIECTQDVCMGNVCSNPSVASGNACAGGVCDGMNVCVECVSNAQCGGATPFCNVGTNTCEGCLNDGDCNDSNECTIDSCNVGSGTCQFASRSVGTFCAAGSCDGAAVNPVCLPEDKDGDSILDRDDADDDNDGIPDVMELGGADLSGDSDGDGHKDYEDVDVVACADNNSDGRCDSLPLSVDRDRDGIPNHFDLDSDNDGLTDIIESEHRGLDADHDGVLDDTTDDDNDGLVSVADNDDNNVNDIGSSTSTPDTDMDMLPDFLDLDSDGDGIFDIVEAIGSDGNGEGRIDNGAGTFLDLNNDGLFDSLVGNPLPAPNSDMIGAPDWRDLDSDEDGIPDATEGHDADQDGMPDTTPLGTDSDNDGMDDAFSLPHGGTRAPVPNSDGDANENFRDMDDDGDGIPSSEELPLGDSDMDSHPNYLDVDDDNDGIPTNVECTTGEHATCEDSELMADGSANPDGTPDYLDLDSDEDGVPDATEGHDANHDGSPDVMPSGNDVNNNGLDDAYDPAQGGTPAPVPNLDMDALPDFRDLDDDNDGLLTPEELTDNTMFGFLDPGPNTMPVDGDMTPPYLDLDSDDDGVPDATEGKLDIDEDMRPDYMDPDSSPVDTDMDGIPDTIECGGATSGCPDSDDDGNPDYLDIDDDNDGIPTSVECDQGHRCLDVSRMGVDTDMDGRPDHLDQDTDNDGVIDLIEGHDADRNGEADRVPSGNDADDDGLDDAFDADQGGTAAPLQDADMDMIPDWRDVDSDGDGIPDVTEANDVNADGTPDAVPSGMDMDNDGIDDAFDPDNGGTPAGGPDFDMDGKPDYLDLDADGDGITDAVECGDSNDCANTDGSDGPDYLDLDSDGDSVPDLTEGHDGNTDGTPDRTPAGSDMDNDGIDDAFDPDNGGTEAPRQDFDGDMTPDFQDVDDDGDRVPTRDEVTDGGDDIDTDEDGQPNRLDTDDDGDSLPTTDELNEDGSPKDTDDDMTPDHLDVDDDGDTIPTKKEIDDAMGGNDDNDGDGDKNWHDIDSDGDGKPDAEEAGDEDMDGTPDYLQSKVGAVSGGALGCAAGSSSSGAGLIAFAMLAMMIRRRRR